jgi:ribosomal protein S18 acetylase RimI-like enzyme
MVTGMLDDPSTTVIVAEADGVMVGCCQLERHDSHAYFGTFAVAPDLQGAGTGRALLAEAERLARDEWGASARTSSPGTCAAATSAPAS